MVIYWPHKRGINLNNEVANLFFRTKQKLAQNLPNQTNSNLYIDILDNSCRSTLFQLIVAELEILILDIIELDLTIHHIDLLKHKIVSDLIQRALKSLLLNANNKNFTTLEFNTKTELMTLLSNYELNVEYLLIYLIFGSSYISNHLFIFDKLSTPKEHVSVLLENFIVQIANLVIFSILKSITSLPELTKFIQKSSLCSKAYISIRSLAFFRNSIVFQDLVYFYVQQPKEIYSSRYKVWLISSSGLVSKYIFMNRLNDLSKLSNLQLISILLIEIQDLVIPRLERLLLIISKFVLYIFINLLGNSIIIGIRIIISRIYNN